jgi:hypothetical protein
MSGSSVAANPTAPSGAPISGVAFTYFAEIGEKGAARRLRADIIRHSVRERRLMQHNPARIVAHDQNMAPIESRSVRAAKLLDPDGDFDGELIAFLC